MSKKSEIKKAIAESEKEIEELEKKRTRSQSALLEALVNNKKPQESDVEYFKVFTQLIEVERDNLRKLNEELKNLNK